jgi:CBS domain-containing protein
MGTNVRDVMTNRPRAVTSQTPVDQVAKVMESDDVGALPIVDGDLLVGMVTDRDIVVRVVAQGRDPRGLPVAEVASLEPVSVALDEDLSNALKLMARHQIRRLPVVDAENRLVGVVSQADVALSAKEKTTGEVVEEISRPPQGPRIATDEGRQDRREENESDPRLPG